MWVGAARRLAARMRDSTLLVRARESALPGSVDLPRGDSGLSLRISATSGS